MLTWEYPPRIVGGLGRHCYYLANSLAKTGWNPTVVTLSDQDKTHFVTRNGVKIITIDPPHYSDFLTWTLLYNYMMANTAILLHKRQPFDLIHAHDWMTFLAGSILKHALGIPMVATFHSTERGRRGGIPSAFEKMINDIEWLGSYEANHVITVSNSIKDELIGNLNVPANKVRVIYNALKPMKRSAKAHVLRNSFALPQERILLFVGRLVWQKGARYFLEAGPAILKEHPEAKIVIVGEGDMHENLNQLSSILGITSKVYITGNINDDKLRALYRFADILLVPSIYEPFGLTVLEGMAAGVPVVASGVGGLKEIVTDGKDGILVAPGNSEMISAAVNKLLSNSIFANTLARNGRARAKYFELRRMADETSKVYEMVVRHDAKMAEYDSRTGTEILENRNSKLTSVIQSTPNEQLV